MWLRSALATFPVDPLSSGSRDALAQRPLAERVGDEVDEVHDELLVRPVAGSPVRVEAEEVGALARREEGSQGVKLEAVVVRDNVAHGAGGPLVDDLADPREEGGLDEDVGVRAGAGSRRASGGSTRS